MDLPVDGPRWGARRRAAVAVAVALLTAAATRALHGDWWLAAMLAVYAAAVNSAYDLMRGSFRRWAADERSWRNSLVTERTADDVHQSFKGASVIDAAVDALHDAGDAVAADRVAWGYEAARRRAQETIARWRKSANPAAAKAAEEGYLGGATTIALSRSAIALRRFATLESTPAWLPFAVRLRVAALLRVVDVVRLLHTPQIERRALIATLYLRAGIVAAAPFAASGSITGLTPLRDTGSVAQWLGYAPALALSAYVALRPTHFADTSIGQPTRWKRYALEQALAVAAVVAAPSWPMAVFAAVAVNWIERPDWRLRKLLVWAAATYVPLTASAAASGSSLLEGLGESAIGLAVTALMAGSYGLMLPVTTATLAAAATGSVAWRLKTYRDVRRDRRELVRVFDDAEASLGHLDDPSARAVLAELAQTRSRLIRPGDLARRRPRGLRLLVSQAITSVVPPAEAAGSDELGAAQIVPRPAEVGELLVANPRNAARLERLVKRVVLEAADSGATGALLPHLGVAEDGRIRIEIANEVPAGERASTGFGSGEEWLQRWANALPDGELIFRGRRPGGDLGLLSDVFTVVILLGRSVFEPAAGDEPGIRAAARAGGDM